MKKILFILSLALCQFAHAAGKDYLIKQLDPTETYSYENVVSVPAASANGIFAYDGANNWAKIATLDGLTYSAGVLSVNASSPAWASLTGTPPGVSTFSNDANYATTAAVTSGLAGKFNNPTGSTSQYIRGDGSLATYSPGTGTVTSITAGTGLSGGVITTSGTISLPNTGTAGTYDRVTTDAQGRVTAGTNIMINAPSRTVVTTTSSTGFQVSATQNAQVCYEGTMSTTSTIGGPSSANVFMETADTNSTTPGDWTIVAQQNASNTITLAVVLQQVDVEPWSMCRVIPAGKFVRVRSSGAGTFSAAINAQQQEVLL